MVQLLSHIPSDSPSLREIITHRLTDCKNAAGVCWAAQAQIPQHESSQKMQNSKHHDMAESPSDNATSVQSCRFTVFRVKGLGFKACASWIPARNGWLLRYATVIEGLPKNELLLHIDPENVSRVPSKVTLAATMRVM